MSKKIVTYVLTLAMIFSVFCNPALGYGTTEEDASSSVEITTVEEQSSGAEVITENTDNQEETGVNPGDTVTDETVTDEEEPEEDVQKTEPPKMEKVTGVKATALSRSSIKVTWKKVTGAKEYHVYRYNSSKGKYVHIKTVKTNSFKNTKLASGKKYFYKVRACVKVDGKCYTGSISESASCRTNPYVAQVKKLKSAVKSHSEIKLSWNKVSGAAGYQVYRYNKEKKKYTLIKTVKTNTFTNKKLKSNTVYSYKVRAYKVQDGKKFYGSYSSVVKPRTEKTDRAKVGELAYSKVGSPYKYGAKGPSCFDCSGFVNWVYSNADITPRKQVPQTSSAGMYHSLRNYKIGSSISSLDKAQMGDIIFFKYGGRISHVGIYYKNGKMIHAANPRKDVCIEDVSDYNKWGYKVVGIVSVL